VKKVVTHLDKARKVVEGGPSPTLSAVPKR